MMETRVCGSEKVKSIDTLTKLTPVIMAHDKAYFKVDENLLSSKRSGLTHQTFIYQTFL